MVRRRAKSPLPSCVITFEPHPREFFAPDQAPARLTSLRENSSCLPASAWNARKCSRFDFEFAKTNARGLH